MISVVLPTYNPNATRLERTLIGLKCQSLHLDNWDLIVVDNNSNRMLSKDFLEQYSGRGVTLVRESCLGLSYARRTGIEAASNEVIVFCDDDNVLHKEFLKRALELTQACRHVGVAGGRTLPEYLSTPPNWYSTGLAPLGCQDFGNMPSVFTSEQFRHERRYPDRAPIGAGMVFRKKAMEGWKLSVGRSRITDRRGNELSSAGDCDMVLHALESGYDCAYWPQLELTHLIPPNRLTESYLSAISRAAYRDFIIVLDSHGIRPWTNITKFGVKLRTIKSWFQCRAWRGPVGRIRWNSSIGQFEGRSKLGGLTSRS